MLIFIKRNQCPLYR